MQRTFPFLSSCPPPKPAPDSLVARVAHEGMAAKVAIKSAHLKQAYVAAQLGISGTYLSLMLKGERPIPSWVVQPLCYLTGSLLLSQHIELKAALAAVRQGTKPNDRIAELAEFLRRVA